MAEARRRFQIVDQDGDGKVELYVSRIRGVHGEAITIRATPTGFVEGDKALPWFNFAVAGGICLVLLILTVALYSKWKEEDED